MPTCKSSILVRRSWRAGVAHFESGPYSRARNSGSVWRIARHRRASEVDDDVYAQLKNAFSDAELVESFLTAAAFEMFPRFIDGMRIPVTPLPAAK